MRTGDQTTNILRSRQYVPFLLLAVFAAALLWPLLCRQSLYWGDILFYFTPMTEFAGSALKHGSLPLWNPYLNLGQPFIGNPQMSVFYPLAVLLPFVSPASYLSIVSGLHVWLCGVLTYLYLLRWTSTRTAALAGACVYMGSACLLGRLQFPPMIQTAAYFPALLWRLDRYLDDRSFRNGLWLAFTVCLTVLAAHAQFGYLILLCCGFYGLCRLRKSSDSLRLRVHDFLQAASGPLAYGLLGLGLASVQILPSLQLLLFSSRAHLDPMQANRFALEPQHLITLFLPRFLGHPASSDYWGGKTAWEPALFVGWIPLLLIGYAVYCYLKRPMVRFWSLLSLFGLWLGFGVWGGLFWLAYVLLPGFSHFHDPARFLLWTTFAFAVLTAFGWDRLPLRVRGAPRYAAALLLGILAPLWWYGQDWNPTTAPENLERPSAALARLRQEVPSDGTEALRLYMPHNSQPWNRFITQGYSDYEVSSPQSVAALQSTLLPNMTMRAGVGTIPAYEPVPVEAVTDLDGLAREAWKRSEPTLPHLVSLFAAPVVLAPLTDQFLMPEYTLLAPRREVSAFVASRPPARAWLTRRVRQVEGRKRILAALSDPDFDGRQETIVSGLDAEERRRLASVLPSAVLPSSEGQSGYGEEPERPDSVVFVENSVLRQVMEADAGEQGALLVYSAAAYPGWRARLGGTVVRPLRANGGLMGVPLDKGKHRVIWEYDPAVVRVGLYLSLFSLGLLSGGMVYSLLRHRQEFPKEC